VTLFGRVASLSISSHCSAIRLGLTRCGPPPLWQTPLGSGEEGRGLFQHLALHLQRAILPTQGAQLLELLAGEPLALTTSSSAWRRQVPSVCSDTPRSFASCDSSSSLSPINPHRLSTELRREWWSRSRHLNLIAEAFRPQRSSVLQTEGRPVSDQPSGWGVLAGAGVPQAGYQQARRDHLRLRRSPTSHRPRNARRPRRARRRHHRQRDPVSPRARRRDRPPTHILILIGRAETRCRSTALGRLGHSCGSDLGVVLHEFDEPIDITGEGG